ncbi:imidazole glycerol phosphate synthase subunit HisH [Candidatus Pelagibacter sp.]|nr:imidazole glycerol phosphate synthase subunit HisH [Candidatus Pelagibacter sp.]
MNKDKEIVGIIAYNSGNIGSILKTVKKFKKRTLIIKNYKDLDRCNKIILPGVGSFGVAIDYLKKRNLFTKLKNFILNGGDTLAICLGMQILFHSSDENKGVKGLNIFKRKIKKIQDNNIVSVPHIGWNKIFIKKKTNDSFLEMLRQKKFYFSHSFADKFEASNNSQSYFKYGKTAYVSSIEYKNLIGLQFHPELSGDAGKEIIKFFLEGKK